MGHRMRNMVTVSSALLVGIGLSKPPQDSGQAKIAIGIFRSVARVHPVRELKVYRSHDFETEQNKQHALAQVLRPDSVRA